MCSCAGKLYAVGGYDGASRQCLSTVEEYDPVSDQWCYVADMSTRRSGAGTCTLCSASSTNLHEQLLSKQVIFPKLHSHYIPAQSSLMKL